MEQGVHRRRAFCPLFPARAARYLSRMTRLSSIPDHHICIECAACGHAGLVAVAPILARGDRTVNEVVARARCTWCRGSVISTYRIIWSGRSDIAMRMGTGQMPPDE